MMPRFFVIMKHEITTARQLMEFKEDTEDGELAWCDSLAVSEKWESIEQARDAYNPIASWNVAIFEINIVPEWKY